MSVSFCRPVALALTMGMAGIGLAGCDPFTQPGTVMLDGAPTINAASMVANPYDLARGRGAATSDGQMAAAAVDRARSDAVKPLLSGEGAMTPSVSGGAQ